jgi:5-methylcytosine-specific restriction protein A
MPTAPPLPCPVPGCPSSRPCAAHDAARARARRELRPVWDGWYRLARWTNKTWGLRARVLRASPLCVVCRASGRVVPATQVDHIVPHRGDPALFWAFENLQALCDPCHSAKTARGE